MSKLTITQLQGITQTNFEITVPTTDRLVVPSTLKATTIQSTGGVSVWTTDTQGNVQIGGSISSSSGKISCSRLTSTGRLNLPVWTTSTRPTSNLVRGTVGFNTQLQSIEVWTGTIWVTNKSAIGESSTNPAPNAATIRTSNPSAVDGNYWYQPPGQSTPIQLYTNFSSAPVGKGYVLVARGRESTDWWNTNGQNTSSLTSTSLDTNTPIAVLSNAFVNGLISSQWNGMRFITNRRNGGDSWLFVGTTSTTFSWTYFQQSASSVSATAQRYNGLWLTGGLNTNWGSGTQWTDTLNYGGSNDCQRVFMWSWSGHGPWQGWSGGSSCTPAGSFQVGGEGHALQLVNCYVEC
jgi:hypothetical protein